MPARVHAKPADCAVPRAESGGAQVPVRWWLEAVVSGNRRLMTLQLSWDSAGSGEPLLLLHGIGSTHDDFAALRPRLDTEYRVLAPDLPGHGRSGALSRRPTIAAITDAVAADLDELGVGRVHVLGNSIGARVALELAARGRARSVVAISPSGLNTAGERL